MIRRIVETSLIVGCITVACLMVLHATTPSDLNGLQGGDIQRAIDTGQDR